MKYSTDLLSTKEKRFFNKPKTLSQVIELFGGDEWAANTYQNVRLNAGQLEMVMMENPENERYGSILIEVHGIQLKK